MKIFYAFLLDINLGAELHSYKIGIFSSLVDYVEKVSNVLVPILPPLHPAVYQLSCPVSLVALGTFCLLYFSLSGGYVVVSPRSFNFDVPEN